MNPSNPSKPVMDVSAPRPSQPPVANAPRPMESLGVQSAPISNLPASPAVSAAPATSKPLPAKNPSAARASGAPVGVITAAVLVMMLLSAAAIIVYITSQTA